MSSSKYDVLAGDVDREGDKGDEVGEEHNEVGPLCCFHQARLLRGDCPRQMIATSRQVARARSALGTRGICGCACLSFESEACCSAE